MSDDHRRRGRGMTVATVVMPTVCRHFSRRPQRRGKGRFLFRTSRSGRRLQRSPLAFMERPLKLLRTALRGGPCGAGPQQLFGISLLPIVATPQLVAQSLRLFSRSTDQVFQFMDAPVAISLRFVASGQPLVEPTRLGPAISQILSSLIEFAM